MSTALRHHRVTGDVPPIVAAHHMGCGSLAEFAAKLPDLIARGFPPADPTTGNFDLDAMGAWQKRDAKVFDPLARAIAKLGLRPNPDLHGLGFVYFVVGGGMVKIGRARNPFDRLSAMIVGSPVPLAIECLVPGGHELEGALHQKFAVERRHGEWFERSVRLAEYMGRLREIGHAPEEGFTENGYFDIDALVRKSVHK